MEMRYENYAKSSHRDLGDGKGWNCFTRSKLLNNAFVQTLREVHRDEFLRVSKGESTSADDFIRLEENQIGTEGTLKIILLFVLKS